jgi:hypothetical protein
MWVLWWKKAGKHPEVSRGLAKGSGNTVYILTNDGQTGKTKQQNWPDENCLNYSKLQPAGDSQSKLLCLCFELSKYKEHINIQQHYRSTNTHTAFVRPARTTVCVRNGSFHVSKHPRHPHEFQTQNVINAPVAIGGLQKGRDPGSEGINKIFAPQDWVWNQIPNFVEISRVLSEIRYRK